MISRQTLGAIAVSMVVAQAAHAHWCHDLWASSYNIVVKPAQDSVTVPATGEATLDIYVQNNMGYPLKDFGLAATASNFHVTMTSQVPKKGGFLLPGEKLKYTLHITRSGSATSLTVNQLTFSVAFGSPSPRQDGSYNPDTMIRSFDGTLVPWTQATVPDYSGSEDHQARHLHSSVVADYQDLAGGIAALMTEFCAGRGSWDGAGLPIGIKENGTPTYCNGTSTVQPPASNRGHSKYDYQHLWAAGELAYRKSALGSSADVLRKRLQYATNDPLQAFKFFPYAILGYLGESSDSGQLVRPFLDNKISGGSADEQAAAKTALYLWGDTTQKTAVETALNSSNEYVQMLAATSLGIVDANDVAVQKLIDTADWAQPDYTETSGLAFYAAHLLNLVAWQRRGWATSAADMGSVSFYSGTVPAAPPKAPTNARCAAQANGSIQLTWNAVTETTDGGVLSLQGYRTYRGSTSRGSATSPPDGYANRDPTSGGVLTGTSATYASLSGQQPTYFAVVAVDNSNQVSVYSQEVACRPTYPPVAAMSCTGTSGVVPLDVSCDSAPSTDPNGVADIKVRTWMLGTTTQTGNTFATTLNTATQTTLQLRVVDDAGLWSVTSTPITARNADGGNLLPTAHAGVIGSSSGAAPLSVEFSSVGSSDPEGQPLTYLWDFGDGTTAELANPTHTYSDTAERSYQVVLTVTDVGGAVATDTLTVSVTTNHPPNLTGASVSRQSGYAPLQVDFNATGVVDLDGDQMSYVWSFGDQSSAPTMTAQHTYADAGTFIAELRVTDDGTPPAVSTLQWPITVHLPGAVNNAPNCDAAMVTPDAGAAPLTVTLDATGCTDADNDQLTVTWLVPRPNYVTENITEKKTTVVLSEIGVQEIRLRVEDSAPDRARIERSFEVNVRSTSVEPAVGGCGCTTGSAAGLFSALAIVGLARLRRRRGS